MAVIYLDARNITAKPAGVARYAMSLIPELVRQAPEHEFVAIRHHSNQKPIEVGGAKNYEEIFVECPIDNLENFLFGHRAIQAAVARGGVPDVYHSLFHVMPTGLRRVLPEAKFVVTMHDFLWLDHAEKTQPTRWKAKSIEAFGRLAIPRTLRMADEVIAISEPTRWRTAQIVGEEKITTIAHGVGEKFFEEVGKLEGVFGEWDRDGVARVVSIGNDKEYKNLGVLVRAFEKVRERGVEARLVLVGACEGLSEQIAHSGVSEWVELTGNVDDETLRRILGGAKVFVFPSRLEGFGLPILEAMAMGVPTVIAGREPMRSIAGEAALQFEPDDEETLENLMVGFLTKENLAEEFRRRGQERARAFRWGKTAEKTLGVYGV